MQCGVERREILEKSPSSSMARKVQTVSVARDSCTFFRCFRPGHLAVTVEQLTLATDQDNPIPLDSHQVVHADTEQCLDLMLNNFPSVCQLMEEQDLKPVSLRYRLKVDLRRTLCFGGALGRLNGC